MKRRMYRIEEYADKMQNEWDEFVSVKSMNGTFLQMRKFLNYHPKERFKDASFIVYNEKNKIVAVCPGCEFEDGEKKVFYSHRGSTFGGLVISEKHYSAKYVIPLVEEVKTYLKSKEYKELFFKVTSDIFSKCSNALLEYAFFYSGFTEYKELSTYIDFSNYKQDILANFSQGKKTNIYNCEKERLYMRPIGTNEEIEVFFDILCENLSKYGVKPVHTLEELISLKDNYISDECEFLGVFQDDQMLAGGMMFYFDSVNCAHTQYLAAKAEYSKLNPMTFLYYSIIVEMRQRGYDKLSWGTVTEDCGKVINMGLVFSKESFGSIYCNNITFHKKV